MSDKKYILGVDDEPINRIIMKELLEDDYELVCAEDGTSCLQMISERIPDLILLDVSMPPGMNGLEVCEQLRADDATNSIPVIFVSALASAEERLAGYKAGGDDYITKPFDENELMQKISLMLAHQNEKHALKQMSDETMHAFMETLTSTGELGVVIAFLKESYACKNTEALASAVFNTLKEYEIEGSVLLQNSDDPEYFFSDGINRPLEKDALLQVYQSNERILTFGQRVVFNAKSGTLLIRNLPDDEGKIGRFRDHLAILMDGLDARMSGLAREMETIEQQQALANVISATKDNLAVIDEQHRAQRIRNSEILSNMGQVLEESFLHLGLTEPQESALKELLSKTESETDALYAEGVKTDGQFDQIITQLSSSLKLKH